MRTSDKRPLMVSNGWIQAAGIVLIVGSFIMGVLTYYTYNDEPPIPEKDASGTVLFARAEVLAGQSVFLSNDLMEYGSIFGHGAYLGPDFTAEYLHRAALSSISYYGGSNSDTSKSRTIEDFKANRYDKATGNLVYTDAQVHAFKECMAYYASFFGNPTSKFGLRPGAIRDPEQIRKLTAFFRWTGLAASAARPGHSYSYTNNRSLEPLVANHATADAIVWSVLSLAALLGGTGLLLAIFGRWNLLGWHGREQQAACTDSDKGREIERATSGGLEYGMQRFHRAVSLTLLVLANLILVVEIVRTTGFYPRLLLIVILVPFCMVVRRLSLDLLPRSHAL